MLQHSIGGLASLKLVQADSGHFLLIRPIRVLEGQSSTNLAETRQETVTKESASGLYIGAGEALRSFGARCDLGNLGGLDGVCQH